jgi:DNA invertase Pin-like site-specific DNA recombinase
VRAAQYVRMSTEHQQYSIANQEAVIADYARAKGFEVVHTYADAGISGLDLAHRSGLRQLLDDVIGHRADFTAVLVYDVSRWGRFQDADESAHYEFLCKQSGIQIHYCAEQFSNDNSLLASLCKALKRSMAGEYSRELSVKVFAGQERLVKLGYKMGGQPGYALRRLLLSPDGTPHKELKDGERKYLSTQRVLMTLGPSEEVEVVRRIFCLYLNQDMRIKDIAGFLNSCQFRRDGRPWGADHLRKILIDPKYAGCAVFGRSTKKLRTRSRVIPKSQWIVTPDSFEAIVPLERVVAAQRRLSRSKRSDEQLLQELRDFVRVHGPVSGRAMGPSNHLPSDQTFRAHFGSIPKAYELAGLEMSRASLHACKGTLASVANHRAAKEFRTALTALGCSPRTSGSIIKVEGLSPFLFKVARYKTNKRGEFGWRISMRHTPHYPCAVARLDSNNEAVLDWILLSHLPHRLSQFSLSEPQIRLLGSVRNTAAELATMIRERLQIGSLAGISDHE